MKKVKVIALTLVVMVSAGVAFTPSDKYFEIAKNLDIFASLFKEINALYVDEVDPEKLIGTGIEAMLESLDPYTNYIPEEDVENFRSLTTGQYAGIGAMIGQINDKVIITMPYADYPADKAGLKIGDEILSVDGIPVDSKEISDVSNMLKGQANTKVDITIKRYGQEKLMNFRFERERVKIKNVPYYGMVGDKVGYIKLEDFTFGTAREVADAVDRLKLEGAKKLILDLRNNPGGLLNEAVNVVNVFIPKGKVVVETKGRVKEWNKSYKTLNNPTDTEIPLIVLVNGGSASAAEIVSGAIQDYDRGILIGQKTYGKGLVQTTRSLSYDSKLKITTAKYYTPSGRCIQSIDYSKRDKNGNGVHVADSLKIAFKTQNGRVVYDGDGLMPDVVVEQDDYAAITQVLYNEGHIFNYATEWYYKNPDRIFVKSDKEFEEFKTWLADKKFTYDTEVEYLLDQLKSSARDESYYDQLQDEITSLETAVAQDKEKDLVKFRNEIMELLEEDIAARVDLYEGQIKASFDDDQELQKAQSIYNKERGFEEILTRN